LLQKTFTINLKTSRKNEVGWDIGAAGIFIPARTPLVKVFNGEFPGAPGSLDLQVVISGAGEFG
jgi:hypothetical protein